MKISEVLPASDFKDKLLKGKKTLIAIMGPTASGKTSVAIELALQLGTEIISVDSRQFYREMELGTAKPNLSQLSTVKHHFINNLSISDIYTAGHFAREASVILASLFESHDTVIAVGGSTLYFKALLDGIDEFPDVTSDAKERVGELEKISGLTGLKSALQKTDPVYFNLVDKNNIRRIVRALEVSYSGHHPYSYYLNRKHHIPDYEIVKIGLSLPREQLYHRIYERCNEMISNGLIDEAKVLFPQRNLKPLHTVGYSEFFEYFEQRISLDEAISLFKQHTRNYAKRQMTWFRKEKDINWVSPNYVLKSLGL